MADTALPTSLNWRPFAREEAKALRAELGPLVGIANPLDYNTFIWGDWPAMIRMYEAALAPEFDLALLVMDIPPADRCEPADWIGATNAFVAAVKQTGARAAIVASLPETMPERLAKDLIAKGVVPLCGLDAGLRAADAARFIGEKWAKTAPPPLLPTFPASAGSRLCGDDSDREDTLDEHASKTELVAAGLIVPIGMTLTTDEVVDLGDMAPPFALKALGIAHKSEAGAVRLNLMTAAEVDAARSGMAHLADRFLLEEMAPKPLVELLIGLTRDPVVGLMLTIGAGGVMTELLDDVANLLLPATETDIREAMAWLKVGRLLDGYRDSDAADIDALIANIICITRYAETHADTLEELDVNPLFATQYGSVAVDALIVRSTTKNKP